MLIETNLAADSDCIVDAFRAIVGKVCSKQLVQRMVRQTAQLFCSWETVAS